MSQPMAPNDGLTANQRRDREYLGFFRDLQAYIEQLKADALPGSVRLMHAKLDLQALVKRAPHLFGVDQHGQPFLRETGR